FLDLSSGTVALIGGSAAALNKLRLLRSAGANVRWYAGDVDVAEEMLLASAPPGRLEVALSDPLQADFSEFAAVVAAAGGAVDELAATLLGARGRWSHRRCRARGPLARGPTGARARHRGHKASAAGIRNRVSRRRRSGRSRSSDAARPAGPARRRYRVLRRAD